MDIGLARAKKIWDETLSLISKKLDDHNIFDAFIADITVYKCENNTFYLIVNSQTSREYVSMKQDELIKDCLLEVSQTEFQIVYNTEEEIEKNNKNKDDDVSNAKFFANASKLSPQFTFDNFVVGASNRDAYQSALLVANQPGLYNPLFIYSKSGLGKTHLLHAIGNYVKNKNHLCKVLYITTDDFITEFVRYVKGDQENDSLKDFFKGIDYLLVDDIQFLGEKQKTSEMFFHIFNTLVNSGKQIILTSDRQPSELKGLEDRLVSRFSSGLSVNIKNPEIDTLINILKLKIPLTNLNLNDFDDDVLEYIAENNSNNIRELEGALNRVVFCSVTSRNTGKITLDFVENALGSLQKKKSKKSTLNEEKIIAFTAEYYNLTEEQITSKSRTSQIALSRQIAMYLCRVMLDTPFKKIGSYFGNKDHSTVMSSIKKVENMLKNDKTFQQTINDIKVKIM